ncbi:MAG TPA: hypothetical protein PK668_03245 [Myxococcota bacterium]|nr:hypothetical protein [Myxococcota bacterium]HRY91870.1 hypothetical protein [Myxococcota bacterium]HSA24730.1 hypothetical protein [Myxococcota bacterium]
MRVLPGLLLVLASAAPAAAARPVYPAPAGDSRALHAGAAGAACESCHPVDGQRERPRAASLRFSHRLHQATPGGCVACHALDEALPEPAMAPGYPACAACHAELVRTRRCSACHPARADGRLVLEAASGALRPRGGHGGDEHGAGWEHGHGPAARARATECDACHARAACDGCHRGVLRPMRTHPGDWALAHAAEARFAADRCGACHRAQTDCLRCHRQAGLGGPRSERDLRVHPEGFAAAHAGEARRNLRACAACHPEGDCVRCHGEPGRGLGLSPHPPGFTGRCGLMRARNPRPCLKCHREERLEVLCP